MGLAKGHSKAYAAMNCNRVSVNTLRQHIRIV